MKTKKYVIWKKMKKDEKNYHEKGAYEWPRVSNFGKNGLSHTFYEYFQIKSTAFA